MPLPSSGPMSIDMIAQEFEGPRPSELDDFYAGGPYVPSGARGNSGPIPASGRLQFSDFYGSQNEQPIRAQDRGSFYSTQGNHGPGAWATSTLSIGTAAADRVVIIMQHSEHAEAAAVKVAGVNAVKLAASRGSAANTHNSIWLCALGNTGGSGTATVQWQIKPGTDSRRHTIGSHIVYSGKLSTAYSNNSCTSANIKSVEGGIGFNVSSGRYGAVTTTPGWTSLYSIPGGEQCLNMTMRYPLPAGTVSITCAVGGSSRSVSACTIEGA